MRFNRAVVMRQHLGLAFSLTLITACGPAGGEDAGDSTENGDGDGDGVGDGDGDGDGDGVGDGDGDGDGDGCDPGPVTTQTASADPPGPTLDPSGLFDGHCGAAAGQMFPPDAPWNQSVRNTCVDPQSQDIISYLHATVNDGQTFRIDMGDADNDFGFVTLAADQSVSRQAFTIQPDYYFPPACDEALTPVVPNGKLEGEPDYSCSGGDCHLTVYDTEACQIFEIWKADTVDSNFAGGCLAVWDTDVTPPDDLRGLACTSADAAGLPIMPLLVTPDEVAAGSVNHALRFILPNAAVARLEYARPTTHNPLNPSWAGDPDPGPGTPPPYGVRLRLRDDFPSDGLSPAAAAMVEALKEYGMFHADGGSVTFIASNDEFSEAKWADANVGLGPNELKDAGMQWTDFEVVSDLSMVETMEGADCSRVPLDEF